jgi:hypothetical protein
MDMNNISSAIKGYLTSGFFWIVIIIILCILVLFFYAYLSRRSKLKYNCLELVRFGNGKIGTNLMKAGLFKTKTFLFGLIDYGSEVLTKVTDGRIIQGARTSHLHDVFGKKGYIVIRSPKDSKILVPISKVEFNNFQALMNIASGDYRDASTRIYMDAVEETKGTWEKLLPYLAIGLCVILALITLVINMQMTNNTVEKVGKMLIAGCENQINVKSGSSP